MILFKFSSPRSSSKRDRALHVQMTPLRPLLILVTTLGVSTLLWGKWPLFPIPQSGSSIVWQRSTTAYASTQQWRIAARYQPFDAAQTLLIQDVLGNVNPYTSPGRIHFYAFGQWHALHALSVPHTDSLLLLFKDATTSKTTHPNGRYLWIHPIPQTGTRFFVDFNHAENLSCSSTLSGTCLRPPASNDLPIYVTAGALQDRAVEAN